MKTKRQPRHQKIDREKLRARLRNLENERIFYMLVDAIELLPPAKLRKLVATYLDLESLRPDKIMTADRGILAEVQRFEKASLASEYYESFNVNSKNYSEKSAGTIAWVAEFRRLLNCCVNDTEKSSPGELRRAMDILFGLLDHIDECHDDVIFFADEGGSWQVGVDWEKVLPVWLKILSATAEPKEYAERIGALLSRHYQYGRDKMLVVARRIATSDQRKALSEYQVA
jgi:hypothetical protein